MCCNCCVSCLDSVMSTKILHRSDNTLCVGRRMEAWRQDHLLQSRPSNDWEQKTRECLVLIVSSTLLLRCQWNLPPCRRILPKIHLRPSYSAVKVDDFCIWELSRLLHPMFCAKSKAICSWTPVLCCTSTVSCCIRKVCQFRCFTRQNPPP